VTTVPEVAASFLFIPNALPVTAGLEGGGPLRSGAKGFAAPLSTAFSHWGHAAMRRLGLSHHMHLLVPTRHQEWCDLFFYTLHRVLSGLQDGSWRKQE